MFDATGLRRLVILVALLATSPAIARADGDVVTPPAIAVLTSRPDHARGLIFVAPKNATTPSAVQGPEILDERGRAVWFEPVAAGEVATDFRVQRYRGDSVLTFWRGVTSAGPGRGQGTNYILDHAYNVIATVKAGNGLDADLHEFDITPEGTALITVYHDVPYDLSDRGGPANGAVVDGIVQEIDIASGNVLFEWHSLDHIALDESHAPPPAATDTAAYDYFHVNAVRLDDQGQLIIDARNTWTVYSVDRKSGEVLSRLGGKKTDYTLGTDVEFAWQHDPRVAGPDTLRIFDNEADPAVRQHSRVIWVRRDASSHSASLLRAFEHPDGLLAGSQGNSQALEREHTFVGWGATGRFSEFDPQGALVFDAQVPAGYDTYRAYRFAWHARPARAPTAIVQRNEDGSATLHAIWNGATDVARWYVVAAADGGKALWPLAAAEWNGFDTTIRLNSAPARVAVIAQAADGHWLGRSLPVEVARE